MATEQEWKFRTDRETLLSINAHFPQKCREFKMETVYYDTAELALSSRRYTLRRRLENDKSVCTLKTPASEPNTRNEWETENAFIENAIDDLIAQGAPEELKELVKPGLYPICGAKFVRLAKDIHLENAELEMALDYGNLFGGGRKEPLCEIEIELKSGDMAACKRYAYDFAETFGLEEEERSKFKRALMLYKGE